MPGLQTSQDGGVARDRVVARRRSLSSRLRRNAVGWLFISPWLIGFGLLTLFPFAASLALSFTKYTLVDAPRFIGLANYEQLVLGDEKFLIALRVTLTYALYTVPTTTVLAIAMAMLLNQPGRGVGFFRAVFYLPSVVSGVGTALLWTYLLDKNGAVNSILASVGIAGPGWLFDVRTALPSLALMNLFNLGGSLLILLAALQGVPASLYEAVELDGGGFWQKFRHVTLPQTSPAIFYVIVVGLIEVLQSFQQAYIMTDGGPGTATLLYGLYLYRTAFAYYQMGYASTLAWVMFVVILGLTVANFISARRWVYYEGR